MNKGPKLQKPENYIISQQNLDKIDNFSNLLDRLTDIPNSEPLNKISVTSAGIHNQKAMISIKSMENPKTYVPVFCEIYTGVNLSKNRGIHMSRCIESIFSLIQKKYQSLDDLTYELASAVKNIQNSDIGYAEINGSYIHKRYTKKSLLESYDTLNLISKAVVSSKKTTQKTGMKVYHITSCPCTKAFTKYSIIPELKMMGLDLAQIRKILDTVIFGSHMQRGTTTLIIDKEKSEINALSLFEILNTSVHLVYELLKRKDEHDLVIRALQKPQFTEDVIRDVAFNSYNKFKKILSKNANIYI
jgi:GTP cyclohydrolase FolE2